MATWQDGPEYAPLERPQDFERPVVADLDVAPEVTHLAALAPKDRPGFADPTDPVAPLANLLPDVKDPRDPHVPFAVVSATMTSDSAWGAAHWNPPGGAPVTALPPTDAFPSTGGFLSQVGQSDPPASAVDPAAGPWGPPTGTPWPAPEQPLTPHSHAAPPGPGGYPAPGTPAWFGTDSYAPPPAAPTGPLTFMRLVNAATPGLCIVLLIGGLIVPLSPLMVGIALGLSSRVQTAVQPVRRVFVGAVAAVVFFAVIGMLTNQTGFADWWHFLGVWSLVICWLTLGAVLWLVYRGLKTSGPVSRPTTWG